MYELITAMVLYCSHIEKEYRDECIEEISYCIENKKDLQWCTENFYE